MFKQFKPKEIPPLGREEISRLFRKGDFHNAVQQCKKAGYQLDDFQSDIEDGVHKLLLSHRSSEALSFIYQHGVTVQYDILTLLIAVFDAGDYHGFLKNAHRFKVYAGLGDKIKLAIDHLMNKGQIADAQAWQRKFSVLRERKG